MIQRFLGRFGNALRGMGFQTWRDVFGDVQAGRLRREGPATPARPGEAAFSRPEDRARPRKDSLDGTPIDVPSRVLTGIGASGKPVWANFEWFSRKHPEYFLTPKAAREHVLDVLSEPTVAIESNLPGSWMLLKERPSGQMIALRLDEGGPYHHVRTATQYSNAQAWGKENAALVKGRRVVRFGGAIAGTQRDPFLSGVFPGDAAQSSPSIMDILEQNGNQISDAGLSTSYQRGNGGDPRTLGAPETGRLAQTSETTQGIADFVRQVRAAGGKHQKHVIGPVTNADRIKDATGFDVRGFAHVLDTSGVRHVLNEHGGSGEVQRGQVPISEAEIALIPDIVANPDSIEAGTTSRGRPAIAYRKQIGGKAHLVEEIHNKKRELALKTLYIEGNENGPVGLGGSAETPVLHTSETRSGSVPSEDIGPTDDDVKFRRDESLVGKDLSLPDEGVLDILLDENRTALQRLGGTVSQTAIRVSADTARIKLQDRLLKFLRIKDAIEAAEGKPLPEVEDVHLIEEGYSSRAAERLQQIELRFKVPILEAMHQSKLPVDQVDEYLTAKHAAERNDQIAKINPEFPDGGSGMKTPEAEAILREARSGEGAQALEEISSIVQQMNDYRLKTMVELGLIAQQDADQYRRTYQNYVSLRGRPDKEGGRQGAGRGYSITGPETRRALGRTTRATNVLANTLSQVEEAAIRGEKNQVALSVYNLAQNHPYPDLWQVNRVERRAVVSKATGLVEYRDMTPMGKAEEEQTIRAEVNGEPVRVRLTDKRLAASLNSLDADNTSFLARFLGPFTRMLSALNTTYNPEFMLTNAPRDIGAGLIVVQQYGIQKMARGMLRDYPRALIATFGGVRGKANTEWQQHFRDFAAAGGKVSFFKLDDVQKQRTDLERDLRQMSQSKVNPKRVFRSFFKGIDLANQAVDNAIRLSAFVNAKRAGMTPRQAASLAKNLTVNFNRRGEWGQDINALYMFFNASVQGTTVLAKAFARSRRVRRMIGGLVVAAAISEMLNGWMNPEEYDEISDFEKSRNMILAFPGGPPLRIPLPYGINAFWEFGRNIGAHIRGGQSVSRSISNVTTTAVDAFNPVGGTNSLMNFIAPTFADPIADIDNNRDFAGRPIGQDRTPWNTHTPNSQMYFNRVSPISRTIATELNELTGGNVGAPGWVDINPEHMDHLFGFFAGAAGSFVERSFFDFPSRLVNGEDILPQDIPFVRAYVRRPSPWAGQSQFYDRMDMINAAHHEITALRNAGDGQAARQAFDDNRAVMALRPLAQQTANALGDLRQAQEAIENNQSLADGARQDRLDRIEDQRQRLLNQFNGRWLQDIVLPERNF